MPSPPAIKEEETPVSPPEPAAPVEEAEKSVLTTPEVKEEDAAVPEVDASAGDATTTAPAEVEAVEEEAKPVVHETRFGMLLEKFRACEMRDASGVVTDIDMPKFFEACDLYRDMLSKLGSAAGFILKDIEGNLKKATVVYDEKPEERKTFSGYLSTAKTVEGVTWLLRGVEFFLTMIKLMFTQEGGGAGVEAYKQTLMQYHGWMLQKTVKIGMRAMPGKDGIVKSEGLVLGDVSPEQKTKLCERDAPPASMAGLEVVQFMVELMKKEGRWDAKKA